MASSSSMSQESNWAWLPEELLLFILTELFMLSDVVSFGSVCTRWRSVFKERCHQMNFRSNMCFSRKQPMLLVPSPDNSNGIRNLYSVRGKDVYDLRLPVPFNSRCIGSCHGWLIFMDSISFVVTLFNPFYFGSSKGTIHLPPFLTARDCFSAVDRNEYIVFPEYYISKAVLSADPVMNENYTVMLVHGDLKSLAYYKPGNESWTCFAGFPIIYDLIYTNNIFLALDFCGELLLWNPESNRAKFKSASKPLFDRTGFHTRRYIAFSASGDGNSLFQAVRLLGHFSGQSPFYRTLTFLVYKLTRVDNFFAWLPVSNIGDGAMFVGDSQSCYVKASDLPGIIPNSIYFTDDYSGFNMVYLKAYHLHGPMDAGIFLIGDGAFRDHYKPGEEHKHLPPPIWILPTI